MTNADMTKCVAYFFRGQNAVGDHQFVDSGLQSHSAAWSGSQDEAEGAKRPQFMRHR